MIIFKHMFGSACVQRSREAETIVYDLYNCCWDKSRGEKNPCETLCSLFASHFKLLFLYFSFFIIAHFLYSFALLFNTGLLIYLNFLTYITTLPISRFFISLSLFHERFRCIYIYLEIKVLFR